jgi:SNF2 family DNA or RNA helicase
MQPIATKYEFKLTPYEHQNTALKQSWNKEEYALFCEMGTGKSKILIDNIGILFEREEITAAVIVAPKGVYKNWQRSELPRHMPDRILDKCDIIAWTPDTTKKTQKDLELALKKDGRFKIFVINVEAFSSSRGTEFATKFIATHQCLMAVDESTTIKNRTAKRTKNIIKVGSRAKYRRILTGSPVTKSPMDLFSQCAFLGGNTLGYTSFYAFQGRYARTLRRSLGSHSFNQVIGYQNLEELTSKLDGFSYRVLKKDCLDLPEKIYIKRVVEMPDEQARTYGFMKKLAVAKILGDTGDITTVTAKNVLTQILRLQQICSGSVKNDDGETVDVPTNKMDELLAVIDEVDGKVIIWSIFVNDILKITEMLNEAFGAGSAEAFHGDTPAEKRQDMVDRFQQPDSKLRFFVGNPRVGGYGLTLTEAKTMIFYNNLYDLEVRLQAEDRAHRIGQKNNVTYIDLVTENTVEEKILKALRDKIDIATLVLNEDYKDWLI